MTAPQRQLGPDYAKMLGIVLVVWGHTIRGLMSSGILPDDSTFWVNLDRAIYLFHMPLFFFLSGMFIQQTLAKLDLFDFFKRNVLIFILPLIFWSYTQSGIQYLASSNVNVERSLEYVLLAPFPPKQQFWFLWSLFLITCLSAPVLKSGWGKWVLTALAVVTVMVMSVGQQPGSSLITYKMAGMTLGEAFFFFPYFVLGLLASAQVIIKSKAGLMQGLLLFVTAIAVYLLLYQESNAVYYLFSIFCVYAIYQCIAFIGESIEQRLTEKGEHQGVLAASHRFFIFVGMNSFIIYLAHIIPEAGIRVALLKLGISDAAIHIAAGNVSGLLFPLLLVPVNAFLMRYWRSAKYFIPVRRLKYE